MVKEEGDVYVVKNPPRTIDEFCNKLDLYLEEYTPASDSDKGCVVFRSNGLLKLRVAFTYSFTHVDVAVTKNSHALLEWSDDIGLEQSYPLVYQEIVNRLTKGLSKNQAIRRVYTLSKKGKQAVKRVNAKNYHSPNARANRKAYLERIKKKQAYLVAGERLTKQRETEQLTQRKLALALGITQATVVSWEKGRVRPSPQNLTKLAIYYDKPYLEVKKWFDDCEKGGDNL